MEFIESNFFATSTAIEVNSGTITAEYLLLPDLVRQYISDGYANDSLTTSITIRFDQTVTINRIAILEHNAKKMNIYYNGLTASTFSITGSGASHTSTSMWTTNSLTSMYMKTANVACTSVTFDIYSTQVANTEKAVGHIVLSALELDFPRIPAAGDYTPIKKSKELSHDLSTGGLRTHFVAQKLDVKIKFKYIEESFRDDLEEIYNQHEPKIFVPFPTSTSWDGILFEANWYGPFEFYKYSDNAQVSGFSGQITLRET